jgi:hypothetical protein
MGFEAGVGNSHNVPGSVPPRETGLAGYPGALVVVSHDDAFAQACACETWRIEDQRVVRE